MVLKYGGTLIHLVLKNNNVKLWFSLIRSRNFIDYLTLSPVWGWEWGLSQYKKELLVISSKYRPRPSLDSILVGDHRVNRSDKAWNIGVAFDETLSLDKHVSSVCKSALFHLWNIAKIRVYLTSESTKTLVHAYVTCRLDNCNSLLLGSPKYMIQKLQRVWAT